IGAAGRNLSEQQIVDAMTAPPAHDVVAFFDLFEEPRNLRGIMLKIAIHGNHVVARAMRKSSRQCSGLTEVSAQPNDRHARIDYCEFLYQLLREDGAPLASQNK